jgi:hypothetical protein
MNTRPPLHLHFLAHPQSIEANAFAVALMHRFVEPPASGGLRIPVFFTADRGDDLPPALDGPDRLDLDAAQHNIIVVLADERMLRTVPNGTGGAWVAFVKRAIENLPLDSSPHHLLPVVLDKEGLGVSDTAHVISAIADPGADAAAAAERRLAQISFHVAARALQLLEHGKVPAVAPDRIKAPVTIFLSHAKADLDRVHHDDPVRQTLALLDELPVEPWFDAQQIATSQDFANAISAGIRDCSITLAFQTDHYCSRPWCRREVLEAKRLGAHVVIVDAVQAGEPRSFPYGGNVPTVRWRFSADPRTDALRVIDRAVLEALRLKHNRIALEAAAEAGEIVLPAAPEALTLANQCGEEAGEMTFLYPDPPLGREELEVLERLRPKASFLTPLTKLARRGRPANIETVAVSISGSDDIVRYGLSKEHFETLSDEIHLYLLLAGLKIAYGGALKGSFTGTSNFTVRLFELVRAYSKLAQGVSAPPLEGAVLNVAPWPLRLGYGDAEWKLFAGHVARYEEGPRPALPWPDDELFPPADRVSGLGSDTPQRRYAWARGLTSMRKRVTDLSQARLVIGGRLAGFAGVVPGVVEEAWLSLTQKKALFLAGGFGGAARAVADALQGSTRSELIDTFARKTVPDYDAARALYDQCGGTFHSVEQMQGDIAAHAADGPAKALNNGLSDAENLELINATDPQRIAGLVLTGVSRM